jgi:hypothetical protein
MFRRFTFLALLLITVVLGGAAPGVGADEPTKAVVIPGGKSCQGTLQIRGTTYKLDQAIAYSSIVLDENCINVLLSSAVIPVDKLKDALNDGNDDKFIFFKPNVKITFSKEGRVRFFNAYGDGASVSASGSDLKGQLVVKDGRVNGSCTYSPDDKKSSFDAQFDLALIPIPQAYFAKLEAEKAMQLEKRAKAEKERKAKEEQDAAKAAAAELNGPKARSLPLPKGATDVEYEKLTGQIHCKCPSDVITTANFLAQQFKAQGWAAAGKDLIREKSAIMKRTKGDATLSIFVRPAEGTTSVQIISSGLSWAETASDANKP